MRQTSCSLQSELGLEQVSMGAMGAMALFIDHNHHPKGHKRRNNASHQSKGAARKAHVSKTLTLKSTHFHQIKPSYFLSLLRRCTHSSPQLLTL